MITYRQAESRDIDTLVRLRLAFLSEGKELSQDETKVLASANKAYFEDSLPSCTFISWLAQEGETVVGTSGITIYDLPPNPANPSGKTGYISNVYTIPAYRRQGIATRLFSLVVDSAIRRSCGKLLLHATDMGRPIYLKYGFDSASHMMELAPFRQK